MRMREMELLGIRPRYRAMPEETLRLSTWSVWQASSSVRRAWSSSVRVTGVSSRFTLQSEGDG